MEASERARRRPPPLPYQWTAPRIVEGCVVRRLLWTLVATVVASGCDHDDARTEVPGDASGLSCRSRVAAEELLPADAVIVGFYDAKRERRYAPNVTKGTPGGPRALVPAAGLEAARLTWISLAAACELDEDYWSSVWFAMDREEEVVVVLEGEGVGDEGRLRCIQRRLGRWAGDERDGMRVTAEGCGIGIQYDEYVGFAPHDDLLVLGEASAVARARQAWNAGRGGPARALLPNRRSPTYLWFAADIAGIVTADEMETALARTGRSQQLDSFANLRTVEFEATLARKYGLRLGGSFGAEEDARAAAAVIDALLDAPPPGLPDWATFLLGELELERDDTRVTVTLPLSRREGYQLGLLPSRAEARQVPAFLWMLLASAL
ncbi:MAG: hypothetical protein KC636_08190 [Myxococcales bacterium]|nr:hypothetical protein [Myxococcales bacterium]